MKESIVLNIANSVLLFLLCLMVQKKAKLFTELFSKNTNLDDSGHELQTFNHRTDVPLSNMVVSQTVVKTAISKLDSSKALGPDGISAVVLKDCEPELYFTLTDLLNICLKESCFSDCWKVSSVV